MEKDVETVIRDFKSSGVEEATQNTDNSFTLVMANDLQTLFKISILNSIKTMAKETVEEGDYPSIKEITVSLTI